MTVSALAAALLVAAAPPAAGPEPGDDPSVSVAPAVARPGDAVLVRVQAPPGPLPAGTLGGVRFQLFRHGGEAWGLAAIPIETPPGPARVEIDRRGPGASRSLATITVVEPGFASRSLRLARRFVEPPASARRRIQEDRRAFAAVWARPFEPPLFRERFGRPREDRVTGSFGDQRVLNGRKQSVHYGLDLESPRGAPVAASNDGVVALARDAYFSGNSVVIAHGAGVFTVYFHMDRIDVQAGQTVKKGERIGVVGSTGRSTGPHLHWSVKVAGLYVDPESLVDIDLGAGTAPPRRAGPPQAPPRADAPAEVPGSGAPAAAPRGGASAPAPVPPAAPEAAAPVSAPAPPR